MKVSLSHPAPLMQLSDLSKRRVRIFISYFLGPLLFIWFSYSIYQQINKQPNLELSWQHIKASVGSPMLFYLLTVLVLMVLNWSIEAFKWKLCVQNIQRVSLGTAFKAILSGVSFSVITPNRVGEYLGRILYMDEGNRLKTISSTITGSISQLIITFVMGFAGMLILRTSIEVNGFISSFWMDAMLFGIAAVTVIMVLFYFRVAWLARWIDKIPAFRKYAWLLEALEGFNATMLLKLLSLSSLRFFVFIIQYSLLFRLYNVDIPVWQALWVVSISFLILAVIPTIALFTDLGLRGEVGLKLFGMFSANHLGIGLTSVSIWFINLVIPALAGSLLILSIKKLLKNKNERIH
jgi:hypothetical protein